MFQLLCNPAIVTTKEAASESRRTAHCLSILRKRCRLTLSRLLLLLRAELWTAASPSLPTTLSGRRVG